MDRVRTVRLLKAVIVVIAGLAVGPPTWGQPAPVAAGRVLEVEVPAPSLEGNLLGTATVQGAAVYLPPSYDLAPSRRYPVVYLLHGIFDNYRVWTEHFGVPSILDRLMKHGEIPELLVVIPNGGNRYGGGFYRDSPVSGNWGSYIASDLVEYVDRESGLSPAARPGRWWGTRWVDTVPSTSA